MDTPRKIVYCNCTYAKVVPSETKREVLRELTASGASFETVADLCEMSARRDPALRRMADGGDLTIAACFPRAVQWLFHAAGAPLPNDDVNILNMREQSADEIIPLLIEGRPLAEVSSS